MAHRATFLVGAGIGAGLMYLMDPEHGPRRRGALRERLRSGMCTTCGDGHGSAEGALGREGGRGEGHTGAPRVVEASSPLQAGQAAIHDL